MAFRAIRVGPSVGSVGLLLLILCCPRGHCCDSVACSCENVPRFTCTRQGDWFVAVTANFQVCSLQSQAQAEETARHCEKVRTAVAHTWCGECEAWTPKCQVVMHRTTADYVRAVGGGSETTLGSSLVKPTVGTVRTRRIDVRTNVDDYLTAALPHEMCHVVVADRFRNRQAPLWFDEGVALQYDPPAKQRLHERDLHLGLERGGAFPLSQLLDLEGYPPADRWGVFYGQSGALVRYLLMQGTAQSLLTCVEQAPRGGMSLALRTGYDLQGWPNLQALVADPPSSRQNSLLQLASGTDRPARASE